MDLNIIDPAIEEDRRWMLATCFPELLDQQAAARPEAMDIVAATEITRGFEGDALERIEEALAHGAGPGLRVPFGLPVLLASGRQRRRSMLRIVPKQAARRAPSHRFGSEPSERYDEQMSGREGSDEIKKSDGPNGEITYTRYEGGHMDRKVLAQSYATLGKTIWIE